VNAILNSKLIHFLIHLGQFNQLSTSKISDLPIRIIDYNNEKDKLNFEKIVERTVLLKNYSENLNILLDKFKFYLNSSLKINTSKTLQNWHDLDFADFIKELNKAIKTQNKLQLNKGLQSLANPQLTKLQEMDWMEVFEVKKAEAQALKTQITQTDNEIDKMVYELYGLTDEEIKIVENS
jgi:hypothetical protein